MEEKKNPILTEKNNPKDSLDGKKTHNEDSNINSSDDSNMNLKSVESRNTIDFMTGDTTEKQPSNENKLNKNQENKKPQNFQDKIESKEKYNPSQMASSFGRNHAELFPRINNPEMFGESEMIAGMTSQNINSYPFSDYSKTGVGSTPSNMSQNQNVFQMPFTSNYPRQGANQGTENMYDLASQIVDPTNVPDMGIRGSSLPMMYQDMNSMVNHNNFVQTHNATPDSKLRPAYLTMEELQKELSIRNLPFDENDKITNIGRLVNYLVDRNYGESDLSSRSDEETAFNQEVAPQTTKRTYSFLEVILINCDNQRKPLLDWLETWKNASKEVNTVEIFELVENNLIKIRIYNKFSDPSGVIEQLNSVEIKCARYYCYSRGKNWGGWEYYEGGVLQKQQAYNSEQQPPLFWKRMCWLENIENNVTDIEKLKPSELNSDQICAVLGTDEEMICVDCGNFEKTCATVHGNFNGHFKSKDLYNRYASLIEA